MSIYHCIKKKFNSRALSFFHCGQKEGEKETDFVDKLICISAANIMILMAQEDCMTLHKVKAVT